MSQPGLGEFQLEIATVFFTLPESKGFLLAGGGALIAQGLVARLTEDLDFFTARDSGSVEAASDAFVAAALAHGWAVELLRTGPEFRRWLITGPETVLVDLAVDTPPRGVPTLTTAGPCIAPEELAARKLLALFGRAEPRDFIDVYVLNKLFEPHITLLRAAESDPGFNVPMFVETLRSHRRIDDGDFPGIDVAISDIRAYFDSWAESLEAPAV